MKERFALFPKVSLNVLLSEAGKVTVQGKTAQTRMKKVDIQQSL